MGFPPKSSILIGCSIIFTIHFGGTSIFGNTHIDIYISSIDLCSLATSHGKAKLPMQGHASLDLDFGQVDSRMMRLVGPPPKKTTYILVGSFKPSEKICSSNCGSFPQVGMNICDEYMRLAVYFCPGVLNSPCP